MKLHFIKEPLLEFGQGEHICPRAGISRYSVYDTKFEARRERILVGAVGTSKNLSGLADWLEKCSDGILPPPDSKQPNLFPAFCGFNSGSGFRANLALMEEITRSLKNSDIRKIIEIDNWNDRVNAAVELYYQEVKFLAQNRAVDVITCLIPTQLYNKIAAEKQSPMKETATDEELEDSVETNFRRALKARTMHLGKPLQLMKEMSLKSNLTSQQDDATKAWNFCTALYYKANQTVPGNSLQTSIGHQSALWASDSTEVETIRY